MDTCYSEESTDPTHLTPIDSDRFREAYEKGFQRTLRFIGSRSVHPAQAEEIAQTAWMKGWQRRAQLRNPSKILAWINSIALNLLRGVKRKQSREQELVESADLRSRPAAADARLDVSRLFEYCGAKDRKLLGLHHIAGYTTSEAGRRCGLKPTAARVRLMRLRRRLRAEFDGRPERSTTHRAPRPTAAPA